MHQFAQDHPSLCLCPGLITSSAPFTLKSDLVQTITYMVPYSAHGGVLFRSSSGEPAVGSTAD